MVSAVSMVSAISMVARYGEARYLLTKYLTYLLTYLLSHLVEVAAVLAIDDDAADDGDLVRVRARVRIGGWGLGANLTIGPGLGRGRGLGSYGLGSTQQKQPRPSTPTRQASVRCTARSSHARYHTSVRRYRWIGVTHELGLHTTSTN